MKLLKVSNLSIMFGGLKAVSDFNITVNEGEIYGLIGPNGSGKTTVFNMLTGVYKPTAGDIKLGTNSIAGCKPYEITKYGVARTFQNIRLFKNLTVLDNVRLSYHFKAKNGVASSILRLPLYFKEENTIKKNALELLKIFNLEGSAYELAENLPYGKQRRLEIARAIATGPKLLLLDEPSMGLSPLLVKEIFKIIKEIRNEGRTVFLVEQNAHMALSIADQAYVLETGRIVMDGDAREIMENEDVKKAYLGE